MDKKDIKVIGAFVGGLDVESKTPSSDGSQDLLFNITGDYYGSISQTEKSTSKQTISKNEIEHGANEQRIGNSN